ncbi:MAG: putative 2OG-Fe(II) oxygenase [Alphaproteobacteria bacterium]|nr:putative 2OG-Fe(II) oxygenase [Alphaproteobacteria bacterium]
MKANSPDIADVLNETASVLRLMGDSRRVIGDIRKALSYSGLTSTSRAKLTRQLALCQIESGDLRESLENLERVQQVKPNQPSTYLLSDWAGYHYRAKNREAYHYLNNPNFIKKYDIKEVAGDLNIREFNTALRNRVANHPTLQVLYKGARGGYSQTRDSGPGSLLADPAPELARLRHCFEQLFERYRAALPDDLDHPFLKLKDTSIRLSIFWGLILKDCTSSPTHRHGDDVFATAIYYPNEDVDQGDPDDPRAGWFEAMPLDLNIKMERSDILEFEPTPGRFIFLPAYFYHRALPMMSPKSRISIVADFQFHPE